MEKVAMGDLLERDKTIVELRALLSSYEQRLARGAPMTPEGHAAAAHLPEPLFLIDETQVDFRSSALENYSVVEAPTVLDCSKPDEPEPFSFVYKVRNGVFGVHPRRGMATATVLGPFAGPPPIGLAATAQTTHAAAPPVRFHISSWIGDFDIASIRERVNSMAQGPRFLTVPPGHPGFIVLTPHSQPGAPDKPPPTTSFSSPWGLLLATVADPPEVIDYAWAEFSDIALFFSSGDGYEVRLLS